MKKTTANGDPMKLLERDPQTDRCLVSMTGEQFDRVSFLLSVDDDLGLIETRIRRMRESLKPPPRAKAAPGDGESWADRQIERS